MNINEKSSIFISFIDSYKYNNCLISFIGSYKYNNCLFKSLYENMTSSNQFQRYNHEWLQRPLVPINTVHIASICKWGAGFYLSSPFNGNVPCICSWEQCNTYNPCTLMAYATWHRELFLCPSFRNTFISDNSRYQPFWYRLLFGMYHCTKKQWVCFQPVEYPKAMRVFIFNFMNRKTAMCNLSINRTERHTHSDT